MRVPISFALTYPERAATDVPQLDLAGGLTLEFEAPDLETFPLLALARAAGERGGTYPCAFNAANEVAVAAFLDGRLAVPRDRGDRRGGARARSTARPRATSTSSSRPTRPARRARRAEACRVGMSIFISILGLGFLILIHEAGHFFVARAVGMRPRKFYIGFPPALVKTTAERHRVRHRRDPARRLREDPGHAPPGAGRPRRPLRPSGRGGPVAPAPVDELRARLEESDYAGARDAVAQLAAQIDEARLSPVALKTARARPRRDRRRARRRTRTGARRPGSASPSSSPARPRTSLLAVVSSRCSFMGPAATARRRAARQHGRRRSSTRRSPAAGAVGACGRATGSSRSTARRSTPTRSAARSRARAGEPLTLTVERDGEPVDLGPVAPRRQTARTLGSSWRGRAGESACHACTGDRDEGDRQVARPARDRRRAGRDLEPGRHRPGLVRGGRAGRRRLPLGARADQPLARAPEPAAAAAARRRPHRVLARSRASAARRSRARSTSASRSSGSRSCCCCSSSASRTTSAAWS